MLARDPLGVIQRQRPRRGGDDEPGVQQLARRLARIETQLDGSRPTRFGRAEGNHGDKKRYNKESDGRRAGHEKPPGGSGSDVRDYRGEAGRLQGKNAPAVTLKLPTQFGGKEHNRRNLATVGEATDEQAPLPVSLAGVRHPAGRRLEGSLSFYPGGGTGSADSSQCKGL